MSGQAVQEHRAFGGVHERLVHLVWREQLAPGGPLVLLAHRCPDVGVHGGGAIEGGGVVRNEHADGACRDLLRPLEDLVLGLVPGRCDDGELKPEQGGRLDERGRDVVAVADVHDALLAERTRVRCDGFWKSMAMCRPVSGRSAQRPALMAWASSSTERSSAGSKSAISRKSLPLRDPASELATVGIMMPLGNAAAY